MLRHLPGSGRRSDTQPCGPRESGGANCESQTAGPRGRDHVGMQSHSIPKVEIESLQSQQRPDADVYQRRFEQLRHGALLRTRSALAPRAQEGAQQQHGHACDQRRGDRSDPTIACGFET